MVSQITRVKNGTIILPEKFRKNWKGAEVFITGEKDTLLIKRVRSRTFPQMLSEFRKIGKKIKRKDVEEAINWARKKALKK